MVLSVAILTGFDCKCNETYDTIFELGKIWGREGQVTRKKRGLPPCCPWLQEICKHGYKFHILKSFYSTKNM